ncbi:glycerol-3-phosphate dehydrogenase (NAD(P)+) [Novosphingobium nitrogenifigens DSM 19370]|uniref:Glycerol-3-phosphate dehydrogenase [NAD(P)+] n=1 Tax=Novosphingobium nitrogenifigens DSM 19370 TaxID=983920 RepID=F1ZC40_9SPHN|nr:NAD(P)H-dependent glycerol-3-phosphate dehydrogenase [Novosphingobium nitrogenifigens]EGD57823.1 glycerol-3-phosphate dehydrogenase (NAD(P)+) [Novosphingobium nitrogenifigens DSM 19370]
MSEGPLSTVGVIGAGAWGTALAQMLASDGRTVLLWAREAELVAAINADRVNTPYLPGIALHPTIRATNDLDELSGLATVLVVTPAQHMGTVLAGLAGFSGDLVLCSKGIEAGTERMMADVARAVVPGAALAVLSGPTFAHEVAAGLPTAVTLACSDGETQWQRLSPVIARPAFRPYFSRDVIGAEIGGAVKNVLAVACGVVEGLRLGQNARAALIGRGHAEMVRFGVAMGAQAETLSGLSGLGDLVLTCTSTASRNFTLGKALGEGGSAAALLGDRRTVAEGAFTAPVLAGMARERGIAMPIAEAVAALVSDRVPARAIVDTLLARPLRAEVEAGVPYAGGEDSLG